MNEFLQQFLVESREYADQASEGLLELERSPRNAELLDAVFRAVHTLKGGAGIVDFFAMDRAVHAAEDMLSAARAGNQILTPELIGHCLSCLDQVVQWLDTIEQTGELPPGTCESEADRIVSRFTAALALNGPARSSPPHADDWLAPLLARHPVPREGATIAIRYVPDSECFFRGEDPVHRLSTLPGLLALEIAAADPWPPLTALDPFRCNLVLFALAQSSVTEARDHFHGHSGECEIAAVVITVPTASAGKLASRERALLSAQLDLLRDGNSAGSYGHVRSAALTASNVLRYCGRVADADLLSALRSMNDTADLRIRLQAELGRLLDEDVAAGTMPHMPRVGQAPKVSMRAETSSRTLRVDAQRIDALVRLTGELTVAKNSLAHLARQAADQDSPLAAHIKARHATFDHLTAELQRSVLALRVLPLRVVFQRFPRLVREMSESLGKPVHLKMAGEDTEADKAIVEMLFEPLLHVVRNAVDHGVESAEVRASRGKTPAATIEMRAARQGDRVLVEVTDDGGGMDVARIRKVAADRSVAGAEELHAMTDAEVIDLVFAPGFSTATQITTVSGRGVGMDAVRTAVERVGGRVSIHSSAGESTSVRITLPFSVMMTTVMSVEAGGQMFGVPLDAVVETLRIPRSSVATVGAARAVVIRDQTVPVLDLTELLGGRVAGHSAGDAIMVVAAFAGQRCALDVDALGERLEVVLKPLEGLLVGTPGIIGTTLLGDGRVLLVLDIAELLQ